MIFHYTIRHSIQKHYNNYYRNYKKYPIIYSNNSGDGTEGKFLPKFSNGMTLMTLSAARKGALEGLLSTPNAPTLLIVLRYVLFHILHILCNDFNTVLRFFFNFELF